MLANGNAGRGPPRTVPTTLHREITTDAEGKRGATGKFPRLPTGDVMMLAPRLLSARWERGGSGVPEDLRNRR
jgi:hypothetical protein